MYFLLIQAQFLFCFYSVLNYLLCSLYELQISDQFFILVLTVAFMTIPAQFDAKTIEDKWYDYWMKTIIFIRQIIEYTINSSQMLLEFCGAYVNNTIQDVLIRRARLKGFNACWVGTDHASTEAKVVAKLKAEGINKNDLTQKNFLLMLGTGRRNMGIILEQLKKVLLATGRELNLQWIQICQLQ
jgi:hypothetical protein